jgi:uncharacterized protein (DUF433 family)
MPKRKKQLFSLTETAAEVPPPVEKVDNTERTRAYRARHSHKERKKRRQASYNKRKEIFLTEFKIQKPHRRITVEDVAILKQLRDYLRTTYAGSLENFRHLTAKQIEFLRHYAKNGRKNISAAARAAGYQCTETRAFWKVGRDALKIPFAEDLLQLFEIEEKSRRMITVEEVVAWFNRIATAAMESGDFTNANRAMENQAKYLGMFVERKEIAHRIVSSPEELDARIAELTRVLEEERPEIERRLN